MLGVVHYKGVQHFGGTRPVFINVATYVLSESVEKCAYRNKLTEHSPRGSCNVSRRAALIKWLVQKHLWLVDLVVDAFHGCVLQERYAFCWTNTKELSDVWRTVAAWNCRWQGFWRFMLVCCWRTNLIRNVGTNWWKQGGLTWGVWEAKCSSILWT